MALPQFWQFLEPGWWALHIIAVAWIYLLGVGHGRKRALREMEERRKREAAPPETARDRSENDRGLE